MNISNSVVAIYDTCGHAEQAIRDLQRAGVDMKRLSVAARDAHSDEQVVGCYDTGDGVKRWGKVDEFWGVFWELLSGSAMFAIPGLGPVLLAGPLIPRIIGALEGAPVVSGVSALGAGLMSSGIPKDSVLKYEMALTTGNCLVIVYGTQDEVGKAKDIIGGTAHISYTVHGETVFA